jgi:hypothetical protein
MAAEGRMPLMFAHVAMLKALNAGKPKPDSTPRKEGREEIQGGPMMTVWIYVDTSKQVGDVDHLKVFANEDAAETWLQENDPEGVVFEYPVME